MIEPPRGPTLKVKASEPRGDVLGHVASAVVHSVINRFSAIVSQAEILKARRASPAELARQADAVIASALEGATLARRLAEYARDATVSAMRPVDLDDLIASRLAARRGDAPAGVGLVGELTSRAVFPGDGSRLAIMVDCLVDNAFEALAGSGRGGLVAVATRTDSRGWLELDVRDDGPGMAPDVLEQALEPFFSTRPEHLGLGLPLARSLWRRHRGAFSIDAPAGRGTLVRLTRPLAD